MNDSPADVVLATLAQVAPEADLVSLGPDAELRVELDIDSMDFLNFVVGIDERTGVDIPERDYPQLSTLNGCIEYLTRRMAEAPRWRRRRGTTKACSTTSVHRRARCATGCRHGGARPQG